MRRRRLLAALAAGALAGCTADSGGGAPGDSDNPTRSATATETATPSSTDTPTPTDSPTQTDSPTPTNGLPSSPTDTVTLGSTVDEATLERTGECSRAGGATATVGVDGTAVRVEGCIRGPTGCSQPRLSAVTREGGRLVVTVETVETGDICTQQLVYRSYAAELRLDALPEVVVVRHARSDGTRVAAETEP
ncbi:hypothetical protein [Halobaculum sp. MBLA0143]|uniref:hypothetical protein n=1 Tax=Halobaculum sp. MBLA0143 TaxID=3079933 RepID=UPI003523BCC0